ncbi:hypothetical protein A9Q99_19335 [Gammaproteobacteria bacterium 45_16_T64]|nr:hypothetical protein A9Q99_19335 [Gammaproteobacteria bacterium 45_16_T64]
MNRVLCLFILNSIIVGLSGGCSVTQILPKQSATSIYQQPERLILINIHSVQRNVSPNIGMGGKPYVSHGNYPIPFSTKKTLEDITQEYALEAIEGWPINALSMYCQVLAVPENVDPHAVLASLNVDDRIAFAQPLHTFTTLTQSTTHDDARYDDPYFETQFEGFQDQVISLHQQFSGDNIKVAIVDTGVDVAHQDLQDQVDLARNFVDTHSEQFVADKHGTAIAGIIAAKPNNQTGIVGIAPNASLMVLKACWYPIASDVANCNSFTLAKALLFALEADADIINLSLSGPDDPLIEKIIEKLVAQGILIIAAEHKNPLRNFPAKLINVISTSSLTAHSQSSDVSAPGNEQLTTAPNNHYDFYSGNSIATAYVSGISALLLQAYPGSNVNNIKQLLSDKTPDPHCITATFLPESRASQCEPR